MESRFSPDCHFHFGRIAVPLLFASALIGTAAANPVVTAPATPMPGTPAASTHEPSTSAHPTPPVKAAAPVKSAKSSNGKLPASDWNRLTPTQRSALAPLANDWKSLDSFRRKKWLELADRYAAMSPTEQDRMQKRMQKWVRLSPEQRRIARKNYTRVKKLHAKKKSEQWEQYQQLPEEKKRELASRAPAKRTVAKPPRPHVTPLTAVPVADTAPAASNTSAPSAAAPATETSAPHAIPVQSSPSTP